MAIRLSPEERAALERHARPRRLSRRRTARALLDLAAGRTPETVAARLGVPEALLAELTARFAAQGLTGVGLGPPPAAATASPPAVVPSLRDDDLFAQYRAILAARRRQHAGGDAAE